MPKESNNPRPWWKGDIAQLFFLLGAFLALGLTGFGNVAAYWHHHGLMLIAEFFMIDPINTPSSIAYPYAEIGLAAILSLVSLNWLRTRPWYVLCLAVIIVPALAVAISLFLFSVASLVIDPSTTAGITGSALAIATLRRLVDRLRNGHRLEVILGDAVARNVMSTLRHSPNLVDLDGTSEKLTYLSCELRGIPDLFEALREKPEALLTSVRMVMEPLIDEILASGGTVEERSNTHVKAFWNAPLTLDHHEQIACNCAMTMVKRLDTVNNQLESLADQIDCVIPQISIGIGLTTGYGIIGNFGTDDRPHYSVIGESAGLADELQKASAFYGPAIIVSEHTKNAVQNNFALIEIDRIAINADNPPTSVYVLVGNPMTKARPEFQDMVDQHARLFRAYRAQNWPQARIELAKCEESGGIHARLYRLYAARLDFYHINPPGIGWDGAFRPHSTPGVSYN